MKKIIFILILFLPIYIYGQNNSDFETQELLRFLNNKEILYHSSNEQGQDLMIIYKNRVFAYINIIHKETDESAFNALKITYFINGNKLIKNNKDKKEILEFVKKELDKNDFLLKDFIDEAYNNILAEIERTIIEQPNGFSVSGVNKDFSSELNITAFELQAEQLAVSIYYTINL